MVRFWKKVSGWQLLFCVCLWKASGLGGNIPHHRDLFNYCGKLYVPLVDLKSPCVPHPTSPVNHKFPRIYSSMVAALLVISGEIYPSVSVGRRASAGVHWKLLLSLPLPKMASATMGGPLQQQGGKGQMKVRRKLQEIAVTCCSSCPKGSSLANLDSSRCLDCNAHQPQAAYSWGKLRTPCGQMF